MGYFSRFLLFSFILSFHFQLLGQEQVNNSPSEAFKSYWFSGSAEISSYDLEQARYGEIHSGTAVLIFVTEPFSSKEQVKVDKVGDSDVPVLKLNYEKKFNTGIYPYSMMTSSFLPLEIGHLIKLTSSSQDWCGHTFMQLNNRSEYELSSYSYFQSQGDQDLQLSKDWLEDEIWSLIRLNPKNIPVGSIKMIPSFFYLRLSHNSIKSYTANIELVDGESNAQIVKIVYPELNRSLEIEFDCSFPYSILSWEETYVSGWGKSAKMLTTKARKKKSIKVDYWNKHKVEDSYWRKELGL